MSQNLSKQSIDLPTRKRMEEFFWCFYTYCIDRGFSGLFSCERDDRCSGEKSSFGDRLQNRCK